MYILELDKVSKQFGSVCAVNELSVRIPRGSIYGFLGPNGAGKTTTLRMIMNIIRPDRGQIRLFGDRPPDAGRRAVGYMPEERGLYRKMTARAILTYFGSLKGLSTAELARRVPEWLDRIELSRWADKRVENLSRGMHQKLQFAVTVIDEPDLLILDEPFSGLDPLNLDLIKQTILDLRSRGKTILFSTHVMHEAEQLCDSILLISRGRSILDGPLDAIRGQHRSNAVYAILEGDTGFLEDLPLVEKVTSGDRQLEIDLSPGGDPQDLLKTLVERVRVRRFELKTPSLHEIFVSLVGADHAEDTPDRPARVR